MKIVEILGTGYMDKSFKNEKDFFFEQGLKEFESGLFWEAMNSFEKSLKLYPSEFKPHYYRGLSNFFHVTQTKSEGPVSPEWADDYYRDAYQDFNSAIKLNTENKFFPRNDFLYYWCSNGNRKCSYTF